MIEELEQRLPEGVLGFIMDGDEIVGVAFEKDADLSQEETDQLDEVLIDAGLGPWSGHHE